MELIVSRFPFIMLIGVWLWISRRCSFGGASKLTELYDQQIAETRRMNVFLERIAVSLEKRGTDARISRAHDGRDVVGGDGFEPPTLSV